MALGLREGVWAAGRKSLPWFLFAYRRHLGQLGGAVPSIAQGRIIRAASERVNIGFCVSHRRTGRNIAIEMGEP